MKCIFQILVLTLCSQAIWGQSKIEKIQFAEGLVLGDSIYDLSGNFELKKIALDEGDQKAERQLSIARYTTIAQALRLTYLGIEFSRATPLSYFSLKIGSFTPEAPRIQIDGGKVFVPTPGVISHPTPSISVIVTIDATTNGDAFEQRVLLFSDVPGIFRTVRLLPVGDTQKDLFFYSIEYKEAENVR